MIAKGILVFLIAFVVNCSWAVAGNTETNAVLSALRAGFDSARSLPAGNRPTPPDTIDIGRLRRVSPTSVRLKLGRPTYQRRDVDYGASTCCAFVFGPRLQAN